MIPLYELLYGSSLAKQRVVDDFSGDTLNERWTTNNVSGSNTFQMSDNIDGGFEIVTGSSLNNAGSITFNNIRQYSNVGASVIQVSQSTSAVDRLKQGGLSNSSSFVGGDDLVWWEDDDDVSSIGSF